MDRRVTIFEMSEQAARREKKARPQAGQRKLKPVRKSSARTSSRPSAKGARKRSRPR